MDEAKRIQYLRSILNISGPHPKASTNTAAHWKGVVDAMKDMAKKAIGETK